MASFCSPETEYRRPLGMVEPGISLMVPSYGQCRGRDMALVLLKTSQRWWQQVGTELRPGYSESVSRLVETRLIPTISFPWVDAAKQTPIQSAPTP